VIRPSSHRPVVPNQDSTLGAVLESMEHMTKAVLYARVSSDRQKQEQTIDSQVAELKRQIAVAGHTLVKEYVDDGYSGAYLDRPALDQLRLDVKADAFDVVYFLCADRIARDMIHQTIIVGEFLRYKKRIIINGKDYEENPENRFTLQVLGAVAQFERAKIIERTRRGALHHVRAGKLISQGHTTFGYRYMRKTTERAAHLLIDEEQAAVIRSVFEMFASGHHSLNAILRSLERQRVPTVKGKSKWHISTVKRMKYDFQQLIAFITLAHNVGYLPKSVTLELVDWSRRNLATDGYISDYAEGVGLVSLIAKVDLEQALLFSKRLSPKVHFPLEQRPRGNEDAMIIRSDDFKHGVALGRVAQTMALASPVVDNFYSFAIARRGIPEYDQVVRRLAAQRFGFGDPNSARPWLAVDRSNPQRRAFDLEMASLSKVALGHDNNRAVLEFLRSSRSKEKEPATKIWIGKIIANLALRGMGIDPFETSRTGQGFH
jgi:DNA invertase Pin-like site-specific DNA recombinase